MFDGSGSVGLGPVAASRGSMGGIFPPVGGSAPHMPPVRKQKNCPNQPFSANFWIFAPPESHFSPSMPHKKKKKKKKKKKSGAATA